MITNDLLKVWYPASVDTEFGGFLSDLTFNWKPEGQQNKTLVNQARHIWTCSHAAHFLNDPKYLELAEYGFMALRDHMWDPINGGFFSETDRSWKIPGDKDNEEKTAYGHSFAIYALASYYHVSGDTSAFNLARKTFFWLEKNSHDSIDKGYFDRLMRDGSWVFTKITDPIRENPDWASWKDMNSSIHLLEAYTELYRVWPDTMIKKRLQEMLILVRDTIFQANGFMSLFFNRNWQAVSFKDSSRAYILEHLHFDHVSFGHDVETAYLLLEASDALGYENDPVTRLVAKKAVDHALENGWDKKKGGFYYGGYYFDPGYITIVDSSKQWWVQAEGLNALLLMSKLYPDEPVYQRMFIKQWNYIDRYLIDHEYGGWFHFGTDINPELKSAPKANIWKVNYHNMRALENCINMLRGDFE
jgi:mannobiose 2-epimerase